MHHLDIEQCRSYSRVYREIINKLMPLKNILMFVTVQNFYLIKCSIVYSISNHRHANARLTQYYTCTHSVVLSVCEKI